MPNRDGTGRCCGNGRAGRAHHHGRGRNSGNCRCEMGPCAQPADEKAVLTARREALQRDLEAIDRRLETL